MTITPPDRGDRAPSLDHPRCGHHSARLSREHPGAGRKRQHFFGLKARAPRQHRHRYRHARPRLHSGEAGGHRQGRQSPDPHRPGRRAAPSPRGGCFFLRCRGTRWRRGKGAVERFSVPFSGWDQRFFREKGPLYGGFALFSPDLPAFSGEKPCFRATMELFPAKTASKYPPPANGRGRAASGAGLREFTCDARARGR